MFATRTRKTVACILGGIVALSGGLGWYFLPNHAEGSESQQNERVNVILQPVGVLRVDADSKAWIPQRYTATVTAGRRSMLSFQIAERIDEIQVDLGDSVREGQVLARLDDELLQAQLVAAAAALAQAEAILAELEAGPRQEQIAAAKAEVLRLQAQEALANATFTRESDLRVAKSTSEQDYDAARFSKQAAEASVLAAQERLNELLAGTRPEQIAAQRAAVKIAEAEVIRARVRLEQTELKSPYAGTVSSRLVDEGSISSPGVGVLEIVETDRLEVRFGVAPAVAKKLQPGQNIAFRLADDLVTATVRQLSPVVQRTTRTREVILDVNATNSSLSDGQVVRVEFATPSSSTGYWVPNEALQPQLRGLWSVLVAEPNDDNSHTASRRDVELLATWGDWSQIRGTLQANEQVIVEGGSRIAVGQDVEVSIVELTPPWSESNVVRIDGRSDN